MAAPFHILKSSLGNFAGLEEGLRWIAPKDIADFFSLPQKEAAPGEAPKTADEEVNNESSLSHPLICLKNKLGEIEVLNLQTEESYETAWYSRESLLNLISETEESFKAEGLNLAKDPPDEKQLTNFHLDIEQRVAVWNYDTILTVCAFDMKIRFSFYCDFRSPNCFAIAPIASLDKQTAANYYLITGTALGMIFIIGMVFSESKIKISASFAAHQRVIFLKYIDVCMSL
jgi:hypothetical protein